MALAAWVRRLLVQRLSGPVTVLVNSEGHRSRYIAGTLAMQKQRGLVELELADGLPHQLQLEINVAAQELQLPRTAGEQRKASSKHNREPTTTAASKGVTGKSFETMKQD